MLVSPPMKYIGDKRAGVGADGLDKSCQCECRPWIKFFCQKKGGWLSKSYFFPMCWTHIHAPSKLPQKG